MSLPLSLTCSRAAFLLTSLAVLAACGDDTAATGTGAGGEDPTGTTTSTSTGSPSPTSSSTSTGTTTTSGGEGGDGGQGGDGTGGDGTGGTGGDGTGGDGTGGTGAGGGQPVECTLGDLVDDDFSYETQLVVEGGHYECSVEGVDESGPTIETSLFCIQGDVAFELTLLYTPAPALEAGFPLVPGQEVTFDDLSEDPEFPPQSTGYVVRSAISGKLLFSWVYGSYLGPPTADADWADPLTITAVEDLCRPDEDDYEHRALDVTLDDDPPVRIFSEQIQTLSGPIDTYEIRVSHAAYNAEIDGGFNLLYRYAILAPETIAEK